MPAWGHLGGKGGLVWRREAWSAWWDPCHVQRVYQKVTSTTWKEEHAHPALWTGNLATQGLRFPNTGSESV